ncbi:heterokaryon incompatibility protein [Colletotrichum asianum]
MDMRMPVEEIRRHFILLRIRLKTLQEFAELERIQRMIHINPQDATRCFGPTTRSGFCSWILPVVAASYMGHLLEYVLALSKLNMKLSPTRGGDLARCRPMFIGPFWDIIPITRNCENALRSVRILGGPRRNIWIDSLCINQDDEKERSAQVALMPRIYAGAAGVLVYLGHATSDSGLAMDAITRSEDSYRCIHLGTRSGVCEGCFEAYFNGNSLGDFGWSRR